MNIETIDYKKLSLLVKLCKIYDKMDLFLWRGIGKIEGKIYVSNKVITCEIADYYQNKHKIKVFSAYINKSSEKQIFDIIKDDNKKELKNLTSKTKFNINFNKFKEIQLYYDKIRIKI